MSMLPWRQLCTLRDDVRSGKLTMDEFAAEKGLRQNDLFWAVAQASWKWLPSKAANAPF